MEKKIDQAAFPFTNFPFLNLQCQKSQECGIFEAQITPCILGVIFAFGSIIPKYQI